MNKKKTNTKSPKKSNSRKKSPSLKELNELLNNQAKINSIANNAKPFIIENYKWNNVNFKLEALITK